MASHRPNVPQRHYPDENLLYRPAWLAKPRGFINFKEKEAHEFNDLIDAFIPKDVRHWDCHEDDWVFSYPETVLRVTNRSDQESCSAFVSSRRLPRDVAEVMSRDLQCMLDREFAKIGGVLDFATLLLRLVEAASAHLLSWRDEVRSTKLGLKPNNKDWNHGWDANFVTDWKSILDNPFGLNLDSLADTVLLIIRRLLRNGREQ